MITPSTGIFSPGRTTTMSPTSTSSMGMSISSPPRITLAVLGARPMSFFMASEVLPFATASKYLPKVIRVMTTAEASKYK